MDDIQKCMNWQAINFDWNQVRAFLATLEEGTLSAAARELGLTQPTLGRQVAALEAHLDVILFERSGRQLIPTPTAIELAEHVRAMGDAATRLSLAATGQSKSIEGLVKITATEMYSAMVLPDFVAGIREQYPGIVIEIVATNSLSDLRQREADIAIRNAEPTDSDLIARRVRMDAGGLFATPDYISRHGPFHQIADLRHAHFVGIGQGTQFLAGLQERGVPVTQENFVVISENHLVHWELAKRGIGIGVNGWEAGQMAPELVPVLKDALVFEFPVWLVAPQELKTSRRVRVVYDALAEHLRRKPSAKDASYSDAESVAKSA
ncbi:MAG: LysR family transcriptional regulator [Boseongicola sp.]